MEYIIIASIIGTFAIYSKISSEDRDFVNQYRWTLIVPFITALLILYSVINTISLSVPDGNYDIGPIEVADTSTNEIFLLNMRIYVKNDVKDNGDCYSVIGIVNPDTGKLIEVESGEESFGDTCYLDILDDNYSDAYQTVVYKKDINTPITARIMNSIVTLLLELVALILSVFVGISFIQAIKSRVQDPNNPVS